ncbi:hypothetical protein HN695_00415 [Candidatus Woesearchaeota archaeon]|jgi:hypothetical protein|nr:hypothetical protein [Candidatus Woesearchaeota archaeon]MBT5271798.1 hypothetical protein [Candidatus Woesearchaeota archaeon]MBT6040683.1 hypothetical protein [Candidatus Woesearchaeota archaeon]MBT6336444.1 hypothetical protein [Candidatus Woesearchaeota archaeon]MBT7926776.1 hypothetical protein [Candidatus Woesearchaeota archaeon]
MDTLFTIRGFIFLIAGLLLFLFPVHVLRWQQKLVYFLVAKLHFRFMERFAEHREKEGSNAMRNIGIFFLVVAVGLFVYAWFN